MFEHLTNLSVADKSAWFSMPQVAPGASVRVNFAGNDNPTYLDAVLRDTTRRAKELKKLLEGGATASVLKEHQDRNRRLLGTVLLQEWRGIQDTDGNEVPFTREHAIEFADKLPDWLLERLVNFAENPESFVERPEMLPPSGEQVDELSGN